MAHEIDAALLEREQELRELDAAVDQAHRGSGRVALIQAPAGLGKTSLLGATMAIAADRGFQCLRARASDLERDFAYGCVRQVFESTVMKATPDERERRLRGAAHLAEPLFDPAAGMPLNDAGPSMLHGLYWLVDNIASEAPLLLCIDDLQWADAESLRFLAYLTPRLDGVPILVAASTRPAGASDVDLARLASAPEVLTIAPRPPDSGGHRRAEHALRGREPDSGVHDSL